MSTASPANLNDIVDEAAANAIRDGAYSLVLGAGASLGAKSKDGRPLPTAGEFAKELVSALGLKTREDTPLPYVWEAALAKLGSERALRHVTTVPRFLGCEPAAHHRLIPTFVWKRIYVFNVDDVIPAVYRGSDRLQEPSPIHFDQDYRELESVNDEVQIIYLHGAEIFQDWPIVFGPPVLRRGSHPSAHLVARLR